MSTIFGYSSNKSSRSVLSDAFLPVAEAKIEAYESAQRKAAEDALQREIDEHREFMRSKRPFIIGMGGC